jgi:hypothetical protein
MPVFWEKLFWTMLPQARLDCPSHLLAFFRGLFDKQGAILYNKSDV